MSNPSRESLPAITNSIIARFESLGAVRDQAVTDGRQVIRLSANAIRAMHRESFSESDALLDDASALLGKICAAALPFPNVYWAGYVQDAMKEYAEAAITSAILQGHPLPAPGALAIEDGPYLNGMAEAASELRRDTLDALRGNDIERALMLMDEMDNIYSVLITVDFPDGVTGGLRRTTDQLRAVLERTRGDVTVAVRQNRLELALQAAERRSAIESA